MNQRGIRFVPNDKYTHITCRCGNVANCDVFVDGVFDGVVGVECCALDELRAYNDTATRPVVIPGFVVVDS